MQLLKNLLDQYAETIISVALLLLAALFYTGREYGRLRDADITPGKLQLAFVYLGAFLLGLAVYKAVGAWTGDPHGWGISGGLMATLAGERFLKKLALEVVYGFFQWRGGRRDD